MLGGVDPWDVVDEAWSAMAATHFACEGPAPYAVRVAKNVAIDALRRAEIRRPRISLDAPFKSKRSFQDGLNPHDVVAAATDSAEDEYFSLGDEAFAAARVSLAKEALFTILSDDERKLFLAVRVHQRSGVAVGRQHIPPITGQRVGQIISKVTVKLRAYVTSRQSEAIG